MLSEVGAGQWWGWRCRKMKGFEEISKDHNWQGSGRISLDAGVGCAS